MNPLQQPTAKTRIAVLGGGLGSLSTVFGITSDPSWRDKYDITVYQMGWRLGGKGASGRNRRENQRIQEHGLHVWMGFYENAFRVMRTCYEERASLDDQAGTTNSLRNWTDAFKPHDFMVIEEQVNGVWKHWPLNFPTNPGVPADGGDLMSPWDFIVTGLHLLRDTFAASPYAGRPADDQDLADGRRPDVLTRIHAAISRWGHILDTLKVDIEAGALVSTGFLLEHAINAAERLRALAGPHDPAAHKHIAWLLHEFRGWLSAHAQADLSRDDAARRLWMQMDMALTMLKGTLEDEILFKGFDAVDDWEFVDWLRHHGASELTLDCALISALYEGGFAYVAGDQSKPNMAAGVVLQSFYRLYLGYKGSVIYKMQAGMGDVVFAPLYRTLQARGVRFEFFHQVKALRYDAAANAVSRIELVRQVELTRPYEPLISVKGVDSWPSEPEYDFIRNGRDLESAVTAGEVDLESQGSPAWKDSAPVSLERGRDYDAIVLGIPVGALRFLCADIVEAKPRWRDMVDHVLTVRTQGAQVWFGPTLEALGWRMPSPCLVNYSQPCAAWLDASQVLCREEWAANQIPGSLAYLCSTLPDDGPPQDETPALAFQRTPAATRLVETGVRGWLNAYADHLWPDATRPDNPHGIDWNTLVDARGGQGEARLDAQFFRANVDASERYVLSVAGSTKYRLRADESGVDGLYLTGDWIRNDFNVGCVESTVIAGLQCARAIAGSPKTIVGERFMRL